MEETKIKDYAGGWITEREGTEVPTFLKIVFLVLGSGCASYLIFYMNGEVNHEDRGALVQAFNKATGTSDNFMYGVAAVAFIYVALLVKFAVSKSSHD